MNFLPKIVSVRVNAGRKVMGSFIDPEWVLHYISAGKWTFRLDNACHTVKTGDMVLLPPRLLHVVQPVSSGRLVQYVVHFELHGPLQRGKFPPVVALPAAGAREIGALFHQLATEAASAGSHRDEIMGGLLAVMLGIYLRHAAAGGPPSATNGLPGWIYVEATIQALHQRHGERNLTLAKIAAASGLSPHYLCRLFKAATGHSIMQYLNYFRLQKAEELLLRSRLNCTQIADAVGFSGIHLFSRSFARNRGASPTAFRKRHAPR